VLDGGPRGVDVTDAVLREAALYPDIDLSFLDLETERAIRRGEEPIVI